MRIWRAHELGDPREVLVLDEIDAPVPQPHEVLLDVDAVGLNFPDILILRGSYQAKPRLPLTPGGEISGTIAALGSEVTNMAVGDRVLWMGAGGCAEQVVAPASRVFPIPESMSSVHAAALLGNYGTNWFGLHDRAQLKAGETVLVHAGAGGIGSAAYQLAKAAGATVFATAGGPAKKEICRDIGADVAIDYLREDFVEVVGEETDGDGVDVVYDPVGGDTFDRSRKVIGWDGRILVVGFTSGRIADAPTNHILLKNYSVVGVHWGASLRRDKRALRRTYDELCAVYAEGKIDPLIYNELPLAAVPNALDLLGSRATYGKIIIKP